MPSPSRPILRAASGLLAVAIGCDSGAVDPELDFALHHRPATDSTATPPAATTPAVAAAVRLGRGDTTVAVGTTLGVGAVVVDSAGHALYDRTVAWTSSDTAVATVAPSGDVRARAVGDATIAAAYGALRQTMRLHVAPVPPPPPVPVAAVAFAPYDTVLALGDSLRIQLRAADAAGHALSTVDRRVAWAVDAGIGATLALSTAGTPSDSSARWVRATGVGIGRVAAAVDGVGAVATIRVAGPTPPATPQVARIAVVVWVPDLVAGETSIVTATAYDAIGRVVPAAPLRIQSANPVTGQVVQDSVGTGLRAGMAFGTLRALAPGSFSIVGETFDGRVFAQTVVSVRAGAP